MSIKKYITLLAIAFAFFLSGCWQMLSPYKPSNMWHIYSIQNLEKAQEFKMEIDRDDINAHYNITSKNEQEFYKNIHNTLNELLKTVDTLKNCNVSKNSINYHPRQVIATVKCDKVVLFNKHEDQYYSSYLYLP